MTDKITLTSLVNLQNQTTAVNAINANNTVIQTAFDNTLSRDGTQPNTMGSNLDMNSNQILNLPAPVAATSPARLIDVVTNPTLALTIPPVGTSGATVPLLNAANTWSGLQTLTLTNATGLPVSTGISGLASGVATFLATPSSANLRSALTDETGTGSAVFATSPALTTPAIGAATGTSVSLTGTGAFYNATAVPAGGTTGTGITVSSVANLGVFFGSGAPTLSAAQGSLYIRTDGSSTTTRMYINTNGSTTWTAVTTSA